MSTKIEMFGLRGVDFDERRMVVDLDPDGDNELLTCECEADAGEGCTCRLDETELPVRFAVCHACDGRGTTTRHIEPDGGGFTASEWAEACDDDPDFAEDYFGGVYDRPCPTCDGRRVVPEVDEDALVSDQHKRVHEAAQRCERDAHAYAREVAAERRMGA